MLSLRSLAFILCSAIRRARALSCSSLHCFPDRINGRKMATEMDRNMATSLVASMQSPTNSIHARKAITARGKGPPVVHLPNHKQREAPYSSRIEPGYGRGAVSPAEMADPCLFARRRLGLTPDPVQLGCCIPGPGALCFRTRKGDCYFRQEHLCAFVQDESALFKEEDREAFARPEIPPLWD
jgi:hypothetical protein